MQVGLGVELGFPRRCGEVGSVPPVGALLTLGSHALRIAIGPQLPVGAPGLPADAAAFDAAHSTLATTKIQEVIDACTRVWEPATGTLSCTSGSATVSGTAVTDCTDGDYVRVIGSGGVFYAMLEKTGTTTGILHRTGDAWYTGDRGVGTRRTWNQPTQSGLTVQRRNDVEADKGALEDALNVNYYDRIASTYRYAYRLLPSDPTAANALLALCDTAADRWWELPQFAAGQCYGGTGSGGWGHLTPRSMATEGLVIRAIRSNNAAMQTFLQEAAYAMFTSWVYNPRTTNTTDNAPLGGRDPGYCVAFLAMAIATMSAGATKTSYAQRLVDGLGYWTNALDANGRLHFADAMYANHTNTGAISQPFTLVHGATGLIVAWQLLHTDPDLTGFAAGKATAEALIVSLAGGFLLAYLGPTGTFPTDWGGVRYLDDDASVTAGSHYGAFAGTPIREFNADLGDDIRWDSTTAASTEQVANVRQVGAMFVSTFAFAYATTANASYDAAARHLLRCAWDGNGGAKALALQYPQGVGAWMTGNGAKFLNEIQRHASQGFAYRAGHRSY